MKRRKRKRRIRWGRVLIVIVVPIIIVGGIVMGCKYNFFDIFMKNDDNKDISVDINPEDLEDDDTSIDEDTGIDDVTSALEEAPVNSSYFKDLEDGEYLTSKGFTLKIENGLAYVDGHLIVNKTYSVPSDYMPLDPYQVVTAEKCNNCLEKEVMDAYKLMQSDAKAVGLNIYIVSGYRSYSYQEGLYNRYVSRDGKAEADTYSARPGHSEHHTGLCFDLNDASNNFSKTDEAKWLDNNAYLYGFVIRYPKGKESVTGYMYESWHLRYVGKDLAGKLYNNGNWITMEEYYGLSSSY